MYLHLKGPEILTTGNSATCVSSGFAQLVSTFSKVIGVRMHHHCAADNRVWTAQWNLHRNILQRVMIQNSSSMKPRNASTDT
jgi:hypothetical protein